VIETLGVEHCCAIYGLTESYGNCAVTDASEPLDVRLHTQGMPLPNWDFKIVDPVTLERVPQGEIGLVLIKGYTTPGYYKDEQGTADTFDADGYFITGDLGRIDEHGRFRFDARLKDMIKTGGINVSPVEVEHLLQSHPLIRQAHVLGVADSIRDELIVAFVEPAAELSEDEVKSYVKERAASFKVPRRVFFRTEAELPRLASGKVARTELKAWAEKELA
jgi:fatty-acyl-CoA synthase